MTGSHESKWHHIFPGTVSPHWMGEKIQSLETREYDEFIRVIKEARQERNVSQEKLSQLLGQSINFVLKIESQGRRIDVVEFYQISKALDIPPRNLFDRFLQQLKSRT